ncbi:MAG: hypothetical protein ACOCTS_00825 [Thermodesulfobacteriota bacterium]
MNIKPLCLIFMLSLLLPAGPAQAHAVHGELETRTAVQIRAVYDGGDPMSYAAVEITRKGEDLPFQTGRTDRNGCFAFKPDKPGNWQIVVKDGMGHHLSLNRDIDKVNTLAENAASLNQTDTEDRTGSLSRVEKALAGIAIIFGLSGLAFWWRGRAERRQYRKYENAGKEE